MRIDKQELIEALRGRGEDGLADRAQADLPEEVDTEDHREQLDRLGINPTDLIGGVGGTFG